MKGIILAGGTGSRLFPVTLGTNKHFLPIYDKPMIYYSFSILLLTGIREIALIANGVDIPRYKQLFGNGDDLGVKLTYLQQDGANGIAEAFIIGKDFIGTDTVCLVLGDNIFYGGALSPKLENAKNIVETIGGACLFGYEVANPESFGVIDFDEDQNVTSIEEKPQNPKSNCAATGLYFYDNTVVKKVTSIQASDRGELEITDLNSLYMDEKKLHVSILGRGFTWIDTGTISSLLEASIFVEKVQKLQGYNIACLEEIAFNQNFISREKLKIAVKKYSNTDYGRYLNDLLKK